MHRKLQDDLNDKKLLILTALLEVMTGIAFLLMPALLASLLLGVELNTSAEIVLAHVAGAALLSLSVVCSSDVGLRSNICDRCTWVISLYYAGRTDVSR
jgi:hypothetical protein